MSRTAMRPRWGVALLLAGPLLLAGCTSTPSRDGAPRQVPSNLANIPDAVPKWEPRSKYGNPDWYEVFGQRYYVMERADGYSERGIASWYGTQFHGKRTSSGEPYDMMAMTAAHKTLPLPTYVRVTNLDNGRSAVVKVNDRGPFKEGRIIDLSYAAATKLGVAGPGTARVEVVAISPGQGGSSTLAADEESSPGVVATPINVSRPSPAKPLPIVADQPIVNEPPAVTGGTGGGAAGERMTVYLQAGAFASRANAERLKSRLAQEVRLPISIEPVAVGNLTMHRVRLGPLGSFEEADRLAVDMAARGMERPRVVIEH